jgi:solute carrier family 44 protein 1 (choline transporter-like protein)
LLFAIYWVGLIVVAVFAFQQGQPHLLAAPFDSTGYQCGYSPGYENFPYALFNQSNSSQFCCVDFCPKINNFSTSNCRYDNQSIACPLFGLYNTSRLIDICYPTNSSEFTQAINLSMGEFEQGMSDIRLTWPIELAVLFIALIISVFFMYLIKWCGACLIWTLIFLFFALTACFGGLCYYMYENPQFADEVLHTQMVSNLQGLEWIAIGIWTFDGIILIIFIVCFKSIRVAIAVIKATATFTEEKVRTILIPFVMFLVMVSF